MGFEQGGIGGKGRKGTNFGSADLIQPTEHGL